MAQTASALAELSATARNICDRRSLTSLKAVWDDRKWIGSV